MLLDQIEYFDMLLLYLPRGTGHPTVMLQSSAKNIVQHYLRNSGYGVVPRA